MGSFIPSLNIGDDDDDNDDDESTCFLCTIKILINAGSLLNAGGIC